MTSWETGCGRITNILTTFPPDTPKEDALGIAYALSNLSKQLWHCYSDTSGAANHVAPTTGDWRDHEERDRYTGVTAALHNPNLPDDGYILESYVPVEEAAHRVGRSLHAISNLDLTSQVASDVEDEIDAVERAERGDLTGRAKQAVVLTRSDASPLQVVAANEIFQEQPMRSTRLFEELDATAAAVAAAHWLHAAAEVTDELANCGPTMVVKEADNIEELATQTPTAVLEMIEAGQTPREAVLKLVSAALAVAKGHIPDPSGLLEEIQHAHTQARRFGPDDPELLAALMPRLTPLDPSRPAHDLLEDLLDGIRGCRLLYREYADSADDDEQSDDHNCDTDLVDTEFLEALKERASMLRNRLL